MVQVLEEFLSLFTVLRLELFQKNRMQSSTFSWANSLMCNLSSRSKNMFCVRGLWKKFQKWFIIPWMLNGKKFANSQRNQTIKFNSSAGDYWREKIPFHNLWFSITLMCLHISNKKKRWKIYFFPHSNRLWNLNDIFTHMLCVTFIFSFRLPALSWVCVCVRWKSTVCCVCCTKTPAHTFSHPNDV
jgi:hypothetical protein